jgi:hypothetical protein
MGQNYLATTVFDEAIKRLNFIFNHCDYVIVWPSIASRPIAICRASILLATG